MSKFLTRLCRLFLGFVFLAAGINGFFVVFGLPPFIETSPQAMALFQFRYLLVFEKSAEIVCGLLLLSNRFVPFSLALLGPIIANIFLLHLFVDPSLLFLASFLVIAYAYLLFIYRNSFLSLLEKKPI